MVTNNPIFNNPLDSPLFLPTLKIVGVIFIFGFALVLFFARRDLKAGLTGELGQRYIGWMIMTPLFLIATFCGGLAAAVVLLFFLYRVVFEYVNVVGVERQYALYIYALIPITFAVAAFVPELYFALPGGSILLLTLIPILSGRIENLYLQLSFAGRGYLYLVWSVGHLILIKQLAGAGMVMLVGVGVALADAMQFTFGKVFGKRIISPAVNPRKAWEGVLGALLGASAGVLLFSFAIPDGFFAIQKAVLALLIGIGAAWGDLASSLVKRAAGTKDWGDIIPGHGGLLDRANSMVIVIPLVYYYSYIVLELA
jgi:phosphatidate cytidylyltransferase